MLKKIFPVLILLGVAFLFVKYMSASESKKRFIKHLLKQVQYLPGRYFA